MPLLRLSTRFVVPRPAWPRPVHWRRWPPRLHSPRPGGGRRTCCPGLGPVGSCRTLRPAPASAPETIGLQARIWLLLQQQKVLEEGCSLSSGWHCPLIVTIALVPPVSQ